MQLRDLKLNQQFQRADGKQKNKIFELVKKTPNQCQIRLAGLLRGETWCFSNEYTDHYWVDCLFEVSVWELKK